MADIVVEADVRDQGDRRSPSGKRKAAALFRLWHGVRDLVRQAERLDDAELVHLLAVAQLLVEERANATNAGVTTLGEVDTSLPN